ncbi:MAG: DUF4234 domain-containing protein [Candidatus Bilamarchaeaceae archaeon]
MGSKRSFLFVLLVSILTLGLYWLYWFYKTNDEVKNYARLNSSPILRLLGLIFFSWLFVPGIYVIYLWLKDVKEVAEKRSIDAPSPLLNSLLFFVVPFWGLYVTYRVQATLNNLWDAPLNKNITINQNDAQKEKPKNESVFVKCPRCKTKNPENNNFCYKCGERLAN